MPPYICPRSIRRAGGPHPAESCAATASLPGRRGRRPLPQQKTERRIFIRCSVFIFSKLQMNMPRHAVDVDRRQLGLDERASVALELLVDVHPVLADPVGGDLLLKVRDLRHIDHLGLYAVGLVAQALDGGHLGGLAAHGGRRPDRPRSRRCGWPDGWHSAAA